MSEEKSFKDKALSMLGMGMAKKAGKELSTRTSKIDSAIDEATSDKPSGSKGRDAGEMGKSWSDTFGSAKKS